MHPRPATTARHRRTPRRSSPARLSTSLVTAVVVGVGLTGAALVAGGHPDQAEGPADQAGVGLAHRSARPEPGADADASGSGQRPPVRQAAALPALPARGAVVRAAGVLRAWDERRAEAWAEGDPRALRELYVDRAGAADVRLLRRYTDRGYRVEGLTTQLLAVDVLEHAPDRWRVRVTDRVTSAVAVRGEDRVRLPRDRADTHVVTLVRANGTWRVSRIRTDPAR